MPRLAAATDAERQSNIGLNRLVTYGLFAAVAAMVANGVLFAVAVDALGVPAGFPLAWLPVLASSAIPAVVATVVYGAIARVSRRPNRAFLLVAAVVLAVSFVPFASPPPGLASAPSSVYATLGAMHVAAAVAIVGLLTRVPRTAESSGGAP